MKRFLIIVLMTLTISAFSQTKIDSTKVSKTSYKKKVLDNVEVNFLYSNYVQNGNHAAVTGGTGDENLTDNTPAILISIPLNDDDVLNIDFGVDVTTSASTDQINPFGVSTISTGGGDDKTGNTSGKSTKIIATSASGGGGGDDQPLHTRAHGVVAYSHTSDNRSFTWGLDGTFSSEKGYRSLGFGAQLRKSFNHENSEFNVSSKVYFDNIDLIYPGEFRPSEGLSPSVGFKLLDITHRNTISASVSFSQIITKRLQISLIADIIKQDGLLSTNYQRVYFKDKPIASVNNFNLAHDIERLPNTRTKHPYGARLNYYVNDYVILRTFYRHYTDDWGVSADTYDVQVPIKLSESFTIFPMYRYHSQLQARYFAPYRAHLSTESFYTSDYDLSTFNSSQYGMGLTVAPPLGIFKLNTSNNDNKVRFKSFDLRYNYYSRSDGLNANIFSLSAKFTF